MVSSEPLIVVRRLQPFHASLGDVYNKISVTEGFAVSKMKLQIEDFHLDLGPEQSPEKWCLPVSNKGHVVSQLITKQLQLAATVPSREGREQHLASQAGRNQLRESCRALHKNKQTSIIQKIIQWTLVKKKNISLLL